MCEGLAKETRKAWLTSQNWRHSHLLTTDTTNPPLLIFFFFFLIFKYLIFLLENIISWPRFRNQLQEPHSTTHEWNRIWVKCTYYGVRISETKIQKNWLTDGKIILQWSWKDLSKPTQYPYEWKGSTKIAERKHQPVLKSIKTCIHTREQDNNASNKIVLWNGSASTKRKNSKECITSLHHIIKIAKTQKYQITN